MGDRGTLRVACVTGVSRGLGVALAAELLTRGFEVVGLGRSADASLTGPRFRFVAADLSRLDALDGIAARMFADVAARAPTAAVLINNAATAGPVGPIGTLAADELADAFAVNLAAPALLANAFVRALAGRARLRVVDISSGSAVHALAGTAAYCAAKAGLEMLGAAAATESSGATFVTIRPGIIDTPMQAYVRAQPVERLPNVGMFHGFHASGSLRPPAETARWVVDRAVLADVANGAVLSYRA